MMKKDYKHPYVVVHCIRPEELMQIGINSDEDPIPGDDADAKDYEFDDDKDFSSNIWED